MNKNNVEKLKPIKMIKAHDKMAKKFTKIMKIENIKIKAN